MTRNSGRNADGTFGPGNPGKPKGTRQKATRAALALLEGEVEGLTRKAIELALEGDTTAMRLCLERIAPPRKDAPVQLSLPPMQSAADAAQAAGAVLDAVAAGELTPTEGAHIMALVETYRRTLETLDVSAVISAIRLPVFDKYIYAEQLFRSCLLCQRSHKMRYSEINQTQLLQDAFHCYRRNNLVISQRSFSRRILGQAPSYYSSMVTRNRKPSRRVLQTLLNVTKTILATFIGNPHFGKPYAVNLNHAREELQDLIQLITIELELMNVTKELER